MKGSRVSHYRLTERLGRGTYGEVWKGVHVDDAGFTVAVKLVSPAVRDDPVFVSALRRECRALDRMDHPSIVRFRDLVVHDGVVAMVLELLEGSDLEGLIGAGPQPVDEVVRVLEASLEGLAYAHARGVVHRDIKPGNLFRCDDGRVKLMDFGIARAADGTRATQTGTLQGTLDYMAPERFSNQSGLSSDVYAMGLVAWELLAGRRACPEGDLAAKLGWHLGVGLTDVRSVRPDCPGWLAEVVSSLGSKEAGARPVDGGAALALLRSRQSVGSLGAVVVPRPTAPDTVSLSSAAVSAAQSAAVSAASSAGPSPFGVPVPRAPDTVSLPSGGASAPAGDQRQDQGSAPAVVPASRVGARLKAPKRLSERWWEVVRQKVDALLASHAEPEVELTPRRAPSSVLSYTASGCQFSLRRIEPGRFWMGSGEGDKDAISSEKPRHKVTLTRGFAMGVHPVTQGLYKAVTGKTPSEFRGADRPVETVSWFDAVRFCNALSKHCGLQSAYQIGRGDEPEVSCDLTARGFRLPTEAEWEYAARAGRDFKYAGANNLDEVAWYNDNSGNETHPVGQKRPNAWGLYDMSGNVWEWGWDWKGDYLNKSHNNPYGPESGGLRVFRGGSWYSLALFARVAYRDWYLPGDRSSSLGFRLVLPVAPAGP